MAVEKVDAKVEALIDLNAEIEWLGEGYGGFDADGKIRGVAEGPVWWKAGGWWNEGGFLLFSDNATTRAGSSPASTPAARSPAKSWTAASPSWPTTTAASA